MINFHPPYPGNLRFTQTTSKTVANTVVETSLFDGGVGTQIIPPVKTGDILNIYISGYISTASNNQISTLAVKIGNTVICSLGGTLPSTLSNTYFEITVLITFRATGVNGIVIGQGKSLIAITQGVSSVQIAPLQDFGNVNIDLTSNNLLDVTYKWNTASTGNSITATNAIIKWN